MRLSPASPHRSRTYSWTLADAIFGGALARLTTSGDFRSVANLAAASERPSEHGSPRDSLSLPRDGPSPPPSGATPDWRRSSSLKEADPSWKDHRASNGGPEAERMLTAHRGSNGSSGNGRRPSAADDMQQVLDSQPPASPGFWVGYGAHPYADGTNLLDTLPDAPAPAICGPGVEDPLQPFCCQPPKVSTIQEFHAVCFGVSTHVLAILHRSGTSPEALAELAGITAPSLRSKDARGLDASHGARWDVAPGVCWGDKGAGQTPGSNVKDPEGYSQLPPSVSAHRLSSLGEVGPALMPRCSGLATEGPCRYAALSGEPMHDGWPGRELLPACCRA